MAPSCSAPSSRLWPWLAAGLLLLGACASGSQDLPDFPPYEQATDYLEFQARLQRYQPPKPQPYPYTEKNAQIFRHMEDQYRLGQAEKARRARLLAEAERRHRIASQQEWNRYQERRARSEVEVAEREAERILRGSREFNARFENYQRRLDRLGQNQEAEAQALERRRLGGVAARSAPFLDSQERNRSSQNPLRPLDDTPRP